MKIFATAICALFFSSSLYSRDLPKFPESANLDSSYELEAKNAAELGERSIELKEIADRQFDRSSVWLEDDAELAAAWANKACTTLLTSEVYARLSLISCGLYGCEATTEETSNTLLESVLELGTAKGCE